MAFNFGSFARLGLTVVGGLVLGPVFGAVLGATLGAAAGFLAGSVLGSMIFPNEELDTEGLQLPKVGAYPIQQASKGGPVPIVYGNCRVAGNILWIGPMQTVKVGDSTRYKRSFLIGVCEGEATIQKIWKGKILVDDWSKITAYTGDGNTGLQAQVGEEFAHYKNDCCVFFNNYPLGTGGIIPNFVFEVTNAAYIPPTFQMIVVNSSHIHMMDMGADYMPSHYITAGTTRNLGGNKVGIPAVAHGYSAGDTVLWGGGPHPYDTDVGWVLDALTTVDEMVISTSYFSHTYTGTEVIMQRVTSLFLDICTPTQSEPLQGDIWYVPCAYHGVDYANIILKVDTSGDPNDWTVDGDFFGAPPTPYTTEYSRATHIDHTGNFLYVGEGQRATLYKFRLSDGVCMWEFDMQSSGINMSVASDGWIYTGLILDGGYQPCRISPEGVQGSTYSTGTSGDANQVASVCPTFEDIVAFGGYRYGNCLYVFATEAPATKASWQGDAGDRIHKLVWSGYSEANGFHLFALNNRHEIMKFGVEVEVDGGGEVTGITIDLLYTSATYTNLHMMQLGPDGNLWCTKSGGTTYADQLLILSLNNLSLIKTIDTNEWSFQSNQGYTPEPIFKTIEAVTPSDDWNPADVIKDLLTDTTYGAGIPEAMLDLTTFAAVNTYCADEDLLISIAISGTKPVWDWVDYICSHFGGFRYRSNGKICLGVFKDESSVATITQDNLVVTDPDSPPVAIKKRRYSESCNRIEVQWTDMANGYNASITVANDEVDQRVSSRVRKKTVNLAGITDPDRAQKMAYRFLIESMYRMTFYSFVLSFQDMLLEVGDVITLSDGSLLTNQKMRITAVSEELNGRGLAIESVQEHSYLYPAIAYETQQTEHDGTPETEPTLLNSTVAIRENYQNPQLHLSIAPANAYVDGWYIYRSYDGVNYDSIGMVALAGITGGDANSTGTTLSRMLTETSVVHSDLRQTLLVNIGTVTDLLTTTTNHQFYNNHRLCRVDDEIMGYKDCVETSTPGIWQITGFIRGLMGTEAVKHEVGATFETLDIDFTYDITPEEIGSTLYFKALVYYLDVFEELGDVTAETIEVFGQYARPEGVSLIRLLEAYADITDPLLEGKYPSSPFDLFWILGNKETGFNRGLYDVHPSWPIWVYGDDEAYLINSNGTPFLLLGPVDPEITSVVLVFEQIDGTPISNRTLTEFVDFERTASIDATTDLGGYDPAVIKVLPRRSLQTKTEHEITVQQE